jgi:hypothetical protein
VHPAAPAPNKIRENREICHRDATAIHQIGFDPQRPTAAPASPARRPGVRFSNLARRPKQNIEKIEDLSLRAHPTHQIGFDPQEPTPAQSLPPGDVEFVFSTWPAARNKISKKYEICHLAPCSSFFPAEQRTLPFSTIRAQIGFVPQKLASCG